MRQFYRPIWGLYLSLMLGLSALLPASASAQITFDRLMSAEAPSLKHVYAHDTLKHEQVELATADSRELTLMASSTSPGEPSAVAGSTEIMSTAHGYAQSARHYRQPSFGPGSFRDSHYLYGPGDEGDGTDDRHPNTDGRLPA